MRWLVVPGEILTEKRMKLGPNVFVENGKIISKVVGLAEEKNGMIRVIPLQGRYVPKPGDTVIGIVTDIKVVGYEVDINSPYKAFLPEAEVQEGLDYGEAVLAKIKLVDAARNVLLHEASPLKGGEIVTISPVKIPRVIGKGGSMLAVLKNLTGCAILVGSNGRIWISGQNTEKLREAILKIEQEAHTSGLTDRITAFLRGEE